jgi:hypothetical protein
MQTHSVGLLWTKDQLVADVATYTTNKHQRYTEMRPQQSSVRRPVTGPMAAEIGLTSTEYAVGVSTPCGPGPLILRFLDLTQRRTTVGRTPLDK